MDNRSFSSLAEQKYDSIRSLRMSDVETVATNTGLTISDVTTMKKHLFFGKHQRFAPEASDLVRKRFDANDDIAEAWLRAQNGPLDARQQQWFRQLRDHEIGERTLMGQGLPFQDLSAWQKINGQWDHVYREGLRGAHELAPRPPKFWPFLNRMLTMIQLKANRSKIGAIRCSGRASDVTGSLVPFAIVTVELSDATDPHAPFEITYDDPECVNQSGVKYANVEEEKYYIAGAARGVKDAAGHYESLGVGLQGLRVRLVKLIAHEIDSSERAFWLAAKNAMAACLVNVK